MLFFLYLHLNMNELFIYHNIFLLQTEGPSLSVRGSKSALVDACEDFIAHFSTGGRNPSGEGPQQHRDVSHSLVF